MVVMTDLSPAVQAFLKALGSEGRQQALMLFASGRELTVGEVAGELRVGQSTASQQLAMLRDGGLLRSRREGKTVYYRADPQRASAVLDELQVFLRSCC
jgi:DNA-binding transcriptional ArsR family regulator